MKRWGMLIIVLMLCLTFGASAEEVVDVTGGSRRTQAVELKPATVYRTKADNWSDKWFLLKPTAEGWAAIFIHDQTGAGCSIELYNSIGAKIKQEYFEKNEDGFFAFEVEKNDGFFIIFRSFYGWETPNVTFSICYTDTHIMDFSPENDFVLKKSTCAEPGTLLHGRCALCGIRDVEHYEEIPMLPHTPGEWMTEKSATCMETGVSIQRCDVCSEVLSKKKIPPLGHAAGDWVTIQSATCEEAGERGVFCTVCNAQLETETLLAFGHAPGDWETVWDASCLEPGKEVRYCTNCWEVMEERETPALGHTSGDWELLWEPSCLEPGKEVKYCINCHQVTEEKVNPAHGHNYTEWEVTIEPTKQYEGEQRRYCIFCGDTQFEAIPKKKKFFGLF